MFGSFVKRIIFLSLTTFAVTYVFYHEKFFEESITQFRKRIALLRSALVDETVTRNKGYLHNTQAIKHHDTSTKIPPKLLKDIPYKKPENIGIKSLGPLYTKKLVNQTPWIRKIVNLQKKEIKIGSIHYEDDATRSFPLTLTTEYLINNKHICNSSRQISVLVMVHTATDHLDRRQFIRSTYASRDLFLPAEVRVIFLLGRPTKLDQKTIDIESKTHGDIIQGDFLDTYHNLTHKAVMGLRWVTENCLNAKYVVKVDDDVVFDMWKFLESFPDEGNGMSIWCNVLKGAIINRLGKWAVSWREFKGRVIYPWPYCAGIVAVMNTGVIPLMYEAAFKTPYFWVDDVYVYGILRTNAKVIALKQMPRQYSVSNSMSYCLDSQPTCPLMAVNIKSGNHTSIWKKMKTRAIHERR